MGALSSSLPSKHYYHIISYHIRRFAITKMFGGERRKRKCGGLGVGVFRSAGVAGNGKFRFRCGGNNTEFSVSNFV